MLEGEAIGGKKLIHHGGAAGRYPLLLASLGLVIHLIEALEFVLMALAAENLVNHGNRLDVTAALHMLLQVVMTDRAGKPGMFGAFL